ncbi:hypothetical protein Vadar_005148 [Vaccinium darrowii]|uniref:Uncharacterized protein n=1 Tax=Vaccinium darrowii TaxID=229202 RepID=A0ACB7WYC0_9ERIC|nr:hypothetical protein Vadar_005148 [Vaccinium darrowii]
MNRRIRRPSQSHKLLAEEERYLRYLKPGALAQLRDSKISARSHRSTDSHFHQIYLYHRTPSPPSPSQIDGYLCFSGRIYGPRCPQRKKLCAPKSAFFNPLSPASDSPDSIIDLFSSDMLVGH